MAQNLNLFLRATNLIAMARGDLNTDDQNLQHHPGSLAFVNTPFGPAIYRYGQTRQSGGMSKGELSARVNDVTGTVTAASGETNDTTHLAATNIFTANAERNKALIITDDAGGAGEAPEGEVALVSDNTASQVTLDPDYALSTSPAAGDTFRIFSIATHDDSADGDLAVNILGIVMADRTAAYFGWMQCYGFNPGVLYTTAAVSRAGQILIADVTALKDRGTAGAQLWVGSAPEAVQGDLASPFRSAAIIDVFSFHQPLA